VNKPVFFIFFILSFVFFNTGLSALPGDSTKVAKIPRHYFNTMIYSDLYSLDKKPLDTMNKISKGLNSYQLSQFSLGFNMPIVTKDFYNKDSTRISNIHFLLTANYTSLRLNFGGVRDHQLIKTSVGFRGIYNNGKKSIFFVELSPFVTRDNGYAYTKTYRLASTILWDYSVSPRFSLRFGYTRSFLWGNRFQLPYVGIRMGRLDKINFSIQFPRSATFNVPVGKHVKFCLYTKPVGGLYSFANTDSIRVGSKNDNQKLYFGRSEFLSGLRIDVLPTRFFNFYLSSGFTTKNYIAFFPSTKEKDDPLYTYNSYYKEKVKAGIFINAGLVFRFGKTRSYYNNLQMYNAMDLNNNIDGGDNGISPGNGNIPTPSDKIHKTSVDQVLDLIEAQDLY
jgi:hypothetical protein